MIKLKWPEKNLGVVSLLGSFSYIAAAAVSRFLYSPFRGSSGAPIYEQDVAYAVIRQILARMSAEQTQGLTATTEEVYLSEAAKINWTPASIDLAGEAKGHWLGDSKAEYVMLYFHGGGYIGYATPGHLKYQFALQKAMVDAGHSFAIFSVSYKLAPVITYPQQLDQAVSALKYLLEHEQRSPQKTFIAGDSAGGNLSAALLMHLARPHLLVSQLQISSKIRGALLISPWVSFDTSHQSYILNADSDYLSARAINRASAAFVGLDESGNPRPHDKFSEPIQAPSDWWTAIADDVVDDLAIWGGGGEILIDGIRSFAWQVAAGFAKSKADSPGNKVSAGGFGQIEDKKGDRNSTVHGHADGTNDQIQNHAAIGKPSSLDRMVYLESPRASHEEQIMNHTLFVSKQHSATVIEDWLRPRLSK